MGLQALGPIMGVARMLGGSAAKSGAMGDTFSNPFDNVFNPEIQSQEMGMPERNPRFEEQAEVQSVFDETPGLMASALLGGDTEGAMLDAPPGAEVLPTDGPKPQRIDLAKLAEEQNEPQRIDLSSMPRPRTNEQMMADQGFDQTTSVQGQPMANVFDPQGGVTDIPRTEPGGMTDIPRSQPQSAFDEDVPAPAMNAAPSAFEPSFDTSAPEEGGPFDSFEGGLGYIQDWLGESNTNPLFQTGMALLGSGYDGSNPFTNMQAGLGGVQTGLMNQQKADMESRKGEAALASEGQQKQLQEALAMIAAMYGGEGEGNAPASQRSKGQASLIR